MEPKEVFKPVPGFSKRYEASNLGYIRNKHSKIVISQWEKTGGYLSSTLVNDDNKRKTKTVHRLVALSHVEGWFERACVNHKDGNKKNNRADNLEWCTRSENSLHAVRIGLRTYAKGADHYRSKLTIEQVREIRELWKSGEKITITKIGERYGVNKGTIHDIIHGRTWKNIK